MRKLLLLAIIALLSATQIYAQQDGLPANPEPGKCYVKCVTHDEFKTEDVTIQVSPEYKVLKVIPATYKWKTEKVLAKEACKKLIYHPAEYTWEEVPYIKKEKEKVLKVIPATFGSDKETIMTFPKTGGWEYSTYAECTSPNPEDCQVLCYIEKPEQYRDVSQKTLTTNASTTESSKPEIPTTYKKQVVSKKAWIEEVEIPAKYKTIKYQVVNEGPKTVEKIIPAKFKTITKEVLVKAGGISVWEEIDCGLVQANELNILWDFNSAKLRPDAKREIDKVLTPILSKNPNVTLELSSHTDSRGTDQYNKALSQRRADAIKNYLVAKGTPSSRLVSKGYGETRLRNNCSNGVSCTERQHQANRRTEYKVIGGK